MKLTLEGIKDCELWNKAGITLPGYDVEKVSQKAKEEPKWVHFGCLLYTSDAADE